MYAIKTQIKFIDRTNEIMHLDLDTISSREKKITENARDKENYMLNQPIFAGAIKDVRTSWFNCQLMSSPVMSTKQKSLHMATF